MWMHCVFLSQWAEQTSKELHVSPQVKRTCTDFLNGHLMYYWNCRLWNCIEILFLLELQALYFWLVLLLFLIHTILPLKVSFSLIVSAIGFLRHIMSPKERLPSLDLLAVLLGHLSPWVDMSTVLYVSHFQ